MSKMKRLDAQRYILELWMQIGKLTDDLPEDSAVIELRFSQKKRH